MTIEFLNYFITTIDEGSMEKAARKLYISRQALSKAIHRTEEAINTKLITSSVSGIEPTEAGEKLYKYSVEIVNTWNKAIKDISSAKRKVQLNVGFGVMTSSFWKINSINRLETDECLIAINKVVKNQDELLKLFNEGKLDIIVSGIQYSERDINQETILELPLYAVVSAENKLSGRKQLSSEDIFGEKILFTDQNHNGALNFKNVMNRIGIDVDISFTDNPDISKVLNIVSENNYIYLTTGTFRRIISPQNCVFIPFNTLAPREEYNSDIKAFYSSKSKNMAEIMAFVKLLKNTINKVDF